VVLQRVDAGADDLGVAPIELVVDSRRIAEFSAAYRREVLGMREQHNPGVMEMQAAFCCIGLEVGSDVIDLQ
jgi:hypothetical protein